MKVHELIRVLQCCDKDAEVEATWEGITTDVRGVWKDGNIVTFEVDQASCYVEPPAGVTVLYNSTPDPRRRNEDD